jgi:crotonobetaine/carnitine-CoA ligase
VVAFKPGQSATHAQIHSFCLETGVKFMVPRYIEFADSLPKTPTEKVEKYKLKETWQNEKTWDFDINDFLKP